MVSAPAPHRLLPRILAALGLAIVLGPTVLQTAPASAATLDKVKQASKLTLGYREDARPFSFKDGSGTPTGYSIALCQQVADEVKTELGGGDLTVEWVPVTLDDRFDALAQGKVDLLCASDTVTLERRKQVSFSIPVFPSGIAAMLRSDAPRPLQDVLAGRPSSGPIWRASPAQILEDKTFSVVKGTTGEAWLSGRINDFQLPTKVVTVDSYDAGIKAVLDGGANVFFGDRPILMDAAAESPSASDLVVLDKQFTFEPIALALPRNDDDFRLVVDRSLSGYFASDAFIDTYVKWFGTPDAATAMFFRQSALPK
jgi:polar amino acid transport system substrate-binding protein